MDRKVLKRILLSFLLGCLLYIPRYAALQTASAGQEAERIILNVGYPSSAFSKGFMSDIQAALEVWGSRLAKKGTGVLKGVHAIVFDDEDFTEIYEALRRREIDLLIMNTLDYVEFEHSGFMEPVFVGLSGSEIGYKYVLLVRRDKGITSVQELQNRSIYVETEGVGRMPIVWLEVLLQNEGLPDSSTFFQESKYLEKTSQAVLPVFFGKAAACITNQRAFNTMVELNPQLERELMVLAESPPFLRGVLIYRRDLASDLKEDLNDALLSMHEDVDGQQILMIMREEELIPFRPEYVSTVKALFQEYQKISAKIASKK